MNTKLDILKMIEAKEISVEKGLELIEALEQTEKIEVEMRDESYPEEETEEASDRVQQDRTGKATIMKSIDVALITSKINIERSNVEDVTIELFDARTRELVEKPDWLHFYEEDHYISIKETRTSNISDIFDFFKNAGNSSDNNLFINVKLPLDFDLDKGKFSTVSGNISMIGIRGIDIEAKSVSGKVVATDVKAKIVQLKSTSGMIVSDNIKASKIYLSSTSGKVKGTGSFDRIETKTVSGSIEVIGESNANEITASSVSGKISIFLPEPEFYNLYFDSLSGGIDTGGFAVVDKSISGKMHLAVTDRSDHKFIKANTVSGKIVLDRK
jgi:DUF4097 and DUF4098 domain-containing protein YvlB